MEQKQKGIKPKLIIAATIVLLAAALIFTLIYFTGEEKSLSRFNDYLNTQNYEKAYKLYSKSSEQYENALNEYLGKAIDDYNKSDSSYSVTVKIIDNLKDSGFPSQSLEKYINQIETLHLSKEAYSLGGNMLKEYNLTKAREQYSSVAKLDSYYTQAQNQIDEIDKLLETNENAYADAALLYNDNLLDDALSAYQSILDTLINTGEAETQITKINDIISAWNDEFGDCSNNKCTHLYGGCVKDDILYLPYSYTDTHTIVKYNIKDKTTDIIPITKLPGSFIIEDINTVGDYLYFIAGENVGSGQMIDNPYNIYRMKNDGSDLECVSMGDYTHLIAYKNGFYASSYSAGIVKLDKNLKFAEQLSEQTAVQMELNNNKLYYTTPIDDSENPYTYIVHALYEYDGENTVQIKTAEKLRFGIYSDYTMYIENKLAYYTEKIYIDDGISEDPNVLVTDNFLGIYGIVGDALVCAKEYPNGIKQHYLVTLDRHRVTEYQDRLPENTIEIKTICYEDETLFFSTPSGFVVTDKEYNVLNEIDLSNADIDKLELNNQYNFAHNDEEFYSEDEVVIVQDNFWYYSNPEYNIRIEKKYNMDFDTNVYVAHIRTTDSEYIRIDCPYDNSYTSKRRKLPMDLAMQYDAVFACSSDFFNVNSWAGISIRDGVLYNDTLKKDMMAIYPDGNLVCYSLGDNITSEELLAAGVKDTLSFGPVLLKDYEYGSKVYNDHLSLRNPRNSIGMVEPGHYIVVLCDGREPNSLGLSCRSLADVFHAEGCVNAYNLDGGMSSIMVFMGECLNTHINDVNKISFRFLPEIIYFATSDLVPDESE